MTIAQEQRDTRVLLEETRLLDYSHPQIGALVESRGWNDADLGGRAKAAYEYVRDEVAFGYNRAEVIPASQVLAEGFGQCNTKGTLLMALLRRCGGRPASAATVWPATTSSSRRSPGPATTPSSNTAPSPATSASTTHRTRSTPATPRTSPA